MKEKILQKIFRKFFLEDKLAKYRQEIGRKSTHGTECGNAKRKF